MSAVDFPTSADKVADVVAGTEPVTPDSVGELGANARGLGGVEQLLFGEDASTLTATTGARRCRTRPRPPRWSPSAADEVLAGWTSGAEPYAQTYRRRPAGVAERRLQRGRPHPAGRRRPEAGHRRGRPHRRRPSRRRRSRARPPRPRRHARRPRRRDGELRGRARACHRPPVRRRRLPYPRRADRGHRGALRRRRTAGCRAWPTIPTG